MYFFYLGETTGNIKCTLLRGSLFKKQYSLVQSRMRNLHTTKKINKLLNFFQKKEW